MHVRRLSTLELNHKVRLLLANAPRRSARRVLRLYRIQFAGLGDSYHQVPVKPADVEKTGFITHVGLFEMAKMLFGFCNAPSTYQRLMTSILQGLIGRICLAYIDDVIVFSKRLAYHVTD